MCFNVSVRHVTFIFQSFEYAIRVNLDLFRNALAQMQSSYRVWKFLKRYGNLQTSFPDQEKVWEIEIKSGKNGKTKNTRQLVEFHVKFCRSQNVSQNFENSLHPNP